MQGSILNNHVLELNLSNTQVTSTGLSNLKWEELECIAFAGLKIESIKDDIYILYKCSVNHFYLFIFLDFDFLQNNTKVKYMEWSLPFY